MRSHLHGFEVLSELVEEFKGVQVIRSGDLFIRSKFVISRSSYSLVLITTNYLWVLQKILKIWGLFWPRLWSVAIFDTNGQIFCHVTTFNGLNAHLFQIIAKASESFVVIQFCPVSESTGPSKDRSLIKGFHYFVKKKSLIFERNELTNRVSRSFNSFLMISVMTSYGSVGSLWLDSFTVWTDQNWGH